MTVRIYTLFAAVLLSAHLRAPAVAQGLFEAPAVTAFDGKAWGGLVIGESTDADIKKACKTQKGAVRPEAMVLTQASGSQVRVDVMMDGRGAKAKLNGFRVAFADGGPTVDDVARTLKMDPETWFPRERYDEWRLVTFPEKGITLFIEGEGRTERASLVLLCRPGRVRDALADCERDATSVRSFREFARKYDDRCVEIGTVSVDVGRLKGIHLTDERRAESDLVSMVRDMRMGDEVVLRRGGAGTLSVSVTASYDSGDRSGSLSASATLGGSTELGRVYASSSVKRSLRDEGEEPEWRGSRRFESVVRDAVDQVVRDAAQSVRRQHVPTAAEVRRAAMDRAISEATK